MNEINIAIIGIVLIFAATTLGSSMVFFFRGKISDKVNNIILGFAGGIMSAASFFGLLLPSIEESKVQCQGWSWVPPLVGFLAGGLLLWLMDKLIPHIHLSNGTEEGIRKPSMNKNLKFFFAVTIHNIPEGLAVGFAAGMAISGKDMSLAYAMLSLAIGIAIQNIPEGAAVSIPLYSEGMGKGKSFFLGTMTGIVEPLFAIAGLFLAQLNVITPWLLSLAGGAMFYVILDEILPDSRKEGFEHHGLWAYMIGFAIMMVLEMVL